jgi:hypothetical protein
MTETREAQPHHPPRGSPDWPPDGFRIAFADGCRRYGLAEGEKGRHRRWAIAWTDQVHDVGWTRTAWRWMEEKR